MTEGITVTGEMLRWARESMGFSVEEVVEKLDRKRVTKEVIENWENNTDQPTYSQLERLAYGIYKRPLALFFFPEPPEEQTPEKSFRTLPADVIGELPARIRFLIRKASALQLNLRELFDGKNIAKNKILESISFTADESEGELAERVRNYLGVDLKSQQSLPDIESAFNFWRGIIEDNGIFIFKDAFRMEGFSGFCLYDEEFPIIYINNTNDHSRQIFTIFHELAHLLFKTGGIDARHDGYLGHLKGNDFKIEVLCNRFAGEFLVPTDDFLKRVKSIELNANSVSQLANIYKVSLTVIYRKLLDNKFIAQNEYDEQTGRLDKGGKRGGEGNYYFNMKVYLGMRYIETVFSHYYQNRINNEQLANYLGVKPKSIDGMEALLHSKGASL